MQANFSQHKCDRHGFTALLLARLLETARVIMPRLAAVRAGLVPPTLLSTVAHLATVSARWPVAVLAVTGEQRER